MKYTYAEPSDYLTPEMKKILKEEKKKSDSKTKKIISKAKKTK